MSAASSSPQPEGEAPSEGATQGIEVPPPLLGSWRALYWLTLGSLGLWMLLSWLITALYNVGQPL